MNFIAVNGANLVGIWPFFCYSICPQPGFGHSYFFCGKFFVYSRNGRDISKISEFNGIFAPDNQKEVLFDKNTKFRITKQETDKGGTVWIEMTEL
jgi:hypothetical protein